MRTVAAVVALVICVHAAYGTAPTAKAVADIEGPIASMSYSPYHSTLRNIRITRPYDGGQIRAST